MDAAAIEEMFQAVGPITIKKMFGGKSMYVRGTIMAIEYQDEILLKADEQTAPQFLAAGCRQWVYEGKNGKVAAMPYWSIPDEAYDDPDEMAKWTRLALEAGERTKK
ncbi:MAG: TfoX/Sxy family protein [Rhizobiaceae bacterium]